MTTRMRILLHACCGPCSLEPARVLREAGHEIAIYYANSNIAPASEYARRLQTLKDWAAEEGIAVIEGEYDPVSWEETAGRLGDDAHEQFGLIADEHAAAFAQLHTNTNPAQTPAVGNLSPEARTARRERCRACYRLRFEEAARYAASHGFDSLGTTLSVSPYQYTDVIEEELRRACTAASNTERPMDESISSATEHADKPIGCTDEPTKLTDKSPENASATGETACAQKSLACAFADYCPFYDEATRRSRELGMYRQNFCGCRFSAEEAAAERKARKEARRAARTVETAERAEKQAREDAASTALKQEKAAYAEKQARKRAILKALREQRQENTD